MLDRDQLHANLGDGIPTGSLILLEGDDGAGKSIFSQRLIYGMLQDGKNITYISTELSTKDFIDQMTSVNYMIDDYIINQKLLFIPMFPFLGGVTLKKDFMSRLMKAKELFQSDVVVIDTFSFLLVKDNTTEEDCFDVIDFLKKLTNKNKTIIFTVDPQHLNKSLLTLLRGISDIYFQLGMKSLAGEERKFIKINRFKKSKGVVSNVIPFRIQPGNGFIIEIGGLA